MVYKFDFRCPIQYHVSRTPLNDLLSYQQAIREEVCRDENGVVLICLILRIFIGPAFNTQYSTTTPDLGEHSGANPNRKPPRKSDLQVADIDAANVECQGKLHI